MGEITFILGAGASYPYGLPLGSELTAAIISLGTGGRDRQFAELQLGTREQIREFVSEFAGSAAPSIDEFLARRPDQAEIGKRAIAAIMLEHEARRPLMMAATAKDNWYQYLIQAMDSEPFDFEALNFDRYSVVTFNYDRSLQRFLMTALINRYRVSEAAAYEKVSSLNIVHMYGDLGTLDATSAHVVPYATALLPESIRKAAENLRVIREGRNNDECVQRTRRLIQEANTVAILGFGFDAINMDRLDFRNTCARRLERPGDIPRRRRIIGTTIGITPGRLHWITAQIARGATDSLQGFRDMNALELLRHELIFGDGE